MRDLKKLLQKELRLAASPLTFLFLAGAAFCMIPNYPALVGAFFVCLGIFYSFQNARESNDTLYSVLLPIAKCDAVRAKYLFVVFVQAAAFVLFCIFTAIRMSLSSAAPYDSTVLMRPNPAFLGYVLLIFAIFQTVFIGGFYKTAYALGKPFLLFSIFAFLFVALSETLHHFPALAFLNASETGALPLQFAVLGVSIVIYVAATFLSMRSSESRFEKIDL